MNLYERIKTANDLTNNLEDVETILSLLRDSNLVTLVSKHSSMNTAVHDIRNLIGDGPTQAQNLLIMATEFYKQQLIKYYELCRDGIVKDIDNIIGG